MPRPLPHFAVTATLLAALAQPVRAVLVARLVVLASLWSRAAHSSLLHQVTIEFHGRSHWLIRLQSGIHKRIVKAVLAAMLIATRRQVEAHQQVGSPGMTRTMQIFKVRRQERSRPFVLPKPRC